MAVAIKAEPVPIRVDEDGVLRVGPSRVTLDLVIWAFNEGMSPEEIVRRFDALRLEDVYSVIGYYLRHRDELDAYLKEREKRAEEVIAEVERRLPYAEFKARLRARQQGMPDTSPGG
ncbi:MAG: DUF433 domain-containing protein [Chloroflexota bacterium]|nr:DUF433 domain-containing protein [Chloroflexota bacterium]